MKNPSTLFISLCLIILGLNHSLFGQQTPIKDSNIHDDKAPLQFIGNKNQWHENVKFRTFFSGGQSLFMEEKGLTYLLTHPEDFEKIHRIADYSSEELKNTKIRQHAYRVNFLNAQKNISKGVAQKKARRNYFLGNDPNKWASNVPVFGKVAQKNLWSGIDLEMYSRGGQLKYDFIVQPHADVSKIQLEYEGVDKLVLNDGNLEIHNSVNTISELAPFAYQHINNKLQQIECQYFIKDNILTFQFPNGYDETQELIIDPTIIAATLSGTVGEQNFGHSATFDSGGNIYTGGRSYGPGYPTTLGAFQLEYAGGANDFCISKYNPDGSDLIYATYIGGSELDLPHSIVADANQQLYVYGSSNSEDYPVTPNAYQTTNGGQTDIVISVLSQDGSSLIGSSYFGGIMNDGINESGINSNYGDRFRGEIIVDANQNIYVVSNSNSVDFPIPNITFDGTLNEVSDFTTSPSRRSQDVVVFKSNSDLSDLFWAGFLGGDYADMGNSLRLDKDKNVYVTGTAGHYNFPTTSGTISETWPGGLENGFIAQISADGSSILRSTFFGSADGDEHAFFLDIDEENQVHIYGQTTGSIPITANTFFQNIGSRQFLAAFDANLENTIYSTVIGNGPDVNDYDFVPVAFMVDKCNGIYFSGYYADYGLPLTDDAISDVGDAFYLGVLEPNATALIFGTYYGESNHVDGGTSRFSKDGTVYQGVCSCTWNNTVMNTLPNAWATTQTTDCDVGVFKIDFNVETVIATASIEPSSSGCVPFTVDFEDNSTNAVDYEWYFPGDSIATEISPSYTFEEAGDYKVTLVTTNFNTCNVRDTFYLDISVLDGWIPNIDTTMCPDESIFLDATTQDADYLWQDGSTNPTLLVDTFGVYWVDVAIPGCSRRDTFYVLLDSVDVNLGLDSTFCDISSVNLSPVETNIISYNWQDGSTASNYEATESGTYSVSVVNDVGCVGFDEIELDFRNTIPIDLGPDDLLCADETLTLSVPIDTIPYQWSTGELTTAITISTSDTIWLSYDNNGCLSSDTIEVEVLSPLELTFESANSPCAGFCKGNIQTFASGGLDGNYDFEWQNGEQSQNLENLCPGNYFLTVKDENNCQDTATINISEPLPLDVSLNYQNISCPYAEDGVIEILTITGGTAPYNYLINGQNIPQDSILQNLSAGNFDILIQDENNCEITDNIEIIEPLDPSMNLDTLICDYEELAVNTTFPNANYLWENGETSPNRTIEETGIYWVDITADGCTHRDSFNVIVSELTVNLGQDTSFCDAESLTLDAYTSSAVSYNWQDNSNNSSLTISQSGIYSVEVIDTANCVTTDEIEINFYESLPFDLGPDSLLCADEVFEISVPIENIPFEWSNGETTETISISESTNINLTLNNNGCLSNDNINIEFLTPIEITTIISNDLCIDSCLGTIEVLSSGGLDSNYQFLWQHGDNSPNLQNLCSGNYTLTVTDAHGCSEIANAEILEPLPMEATIESQDISCFEEMDGIIEIIAIEGGAFPFTYSFDNQNFTSNNIQNELPPGIYDIIIQDANDCQIIQTIELTQPADESIYLDTLICNYEVLNLDLNTPNATFLWENGSTLSEREIAETGIYWVDITTNGCTQRDSFEVAHASINLDLGEDILLCDETSYIIPGTNPDAINYLWQDGSNSDLYTATNSGTYILTVSNSIGCTNSDDIQINFNNSIPFDLGVDQLLCAGEVATLSLPVANIPFEWSTNQTSNTITINETQTISLTLNNNGCLSSDEISIEILPPIELSFTTIDNNCHNDCEGIIEVNTTGGTEFGYSYNWQNAGNEYIISGLCAGTYALTVSDSEGCQGIGTTSISTPPPLSIDLNYQDVSCPSDSDGFIEISTTDGGVAPYIYAIGTDNFSENNILEMVAAGTYEITVQDANGCQLLDLVSIETISDFFIDAGDDMVIDLGEEVSLDGLIFPNTGQEIQWFPADSMDCATCLNPYVAPFENTLYTLMATDLETGCVKIDSVFIYVEKPRNVHIPNVFSPNGDGYNDFFTIFTGTGVEEILELKVFNRWGELVFENYNFRPNEPTLGWNGIFRGKRFDNAVFTYYTKIQFFDGLSKLYKGDVMLMR